MTCMCRKSQGHTPRRTQGPSDRPRRVRTTRCWAAEATRGAPPRAEPRHKAHRLQIVGNGPEPARVKLRARSERILSLDGSARPELRMEPLPVNPEDGLLDKHVAKGGHKVPRIAQDLLLRCAEPQRVPGHPSDGRSLEPAPSRRNLVAEVRNAVKRDLGQTPEDERLNLAEGRLLDGRAERKVDRLLAAAVGRHVEENRLFVELVQLSAARERKGADLESAGLRVGTLQPDVDRRRNSVCLQRDGEHDLPRSGEAIEVEIPVADRRAVGYVRHAADVRAGIVWILPDISVAVVGFRIGSGEFEERIPFEGGPRSGVVAGDAGGMRLRRI